MTPWQLRLVWRFMFWVMYRLNRLSKHSDTQDGGWRLEGELLDEIKRDPE
jgi:hypothetical protein